MTPSDPAKPQAPAVDSAQSSVAAQALAAAGDEQSAQDVGALDDAARNAARRLGRNRQSLVERLIYGPAPNNQELQSGASIKREAGTTHQELVDAAVGCMTRGEAFTTDGKLSAALRKDVAAAKGYGFTVPGQYGGLDASYGALALAEEELAANGLGALAVEISGELTIGAGSLLAYGTDAQKQTFLPLLAEGELMAFGLTEVRIGVNAKKVRAYVTEDPATGGFRLHAAGDRNKLWITNATHGALVALVARIGEDGKRVGLFITRLPDHDVTAESGKDYEFSCTPSGTDVFYANHNSRIHLDNFPIAKEGQIEADGVEVLFYCLRMGRCMLAAMSAGYQRMFAADAANYAIRRIGVGGPVIKHELPRLAIGKMLGGALQSRALSHLSLQQDADGVDLAGLRDLTKSAAACTAMESLTACERVLGGRSFDGGSRVSEARGNMHVFGVVEGEDDLILMGMVKDVTGTFTDKYMAGLLGVIQSINVDEDGKPVAKEDRILRLTPATLIKQPGKFFKANFRLLKTPGFWHLAAWTIGNGLIDLLRTPLRLVPASFVPKYAELPPDLRGLARYATRKLRGRKWTYLMLNSWFQLELTRAQIPLQRFGKTIEHLVSMLVVIQHATASDDPSDRRVARLQAQMLKEKFLGVRVMGGIADMERTRGMLADVAKDVESGQSALLRGVDPQPFAHPWDEADAAAQGKKRKPDQPSAPAAAATVTS